MLRLIQVNLASAGKPHLRNGAPLCFLNFRAANVLLREGSHFGFQILAHEIEFVDTILFGGMECGFCRRQGEDQPASTRVHRLEAEDVAEKCAVRIGVFTVDDYVSARNHLPLLYKYTREFLAGRTFPGASKFDQKEARTLRIGKVAQPTRK